MHGEAGCEDARGLRNRQLHGQVPKKKARGKTLSVTVTVVYQGATKAFPYSFKVR